MNKIVKILIYTLAPSILFLGGWLLNDYFRTNSNSSPNPISIVKPKPLEKYSIENLRQVTAQESLIKVTDELSEGSTYTSNLFSFEFDPTYSGKEIKKVTGLINTPKGTGPFPLVILFRGYINQENYKTGDGSKRVGEALAANGFLTIAPDFLGYAGSSKEADNIFETRFQTYTTAMAILSSIGSLDSWDKENVFIWGHSNGGQIAITTLETTGVDYPTVLWAPVTKPFPYSILYYTDESDDRGKLIRRELALFEENYDVEAYSLTNYLSLINAPIELHQGTADDAVPTAWSDSFVKVVEGLEKDIVYYKYSGADHNLNPSWSTAVARTIQFYKKNIKS